jgi:argininosuccinate lyase
MGRGKTERIVAMAVANLAETLARLSMDMCLFLNQNFDFVSFPETLTTGSSIMPHKKNPDVFELIRARCNRMKALPNEILMMTSNLPSGYHRDLQLLKEHLFPTFAELRECLSMAHLMLSQVSVKPDLLKDPKYKYLFSVEEVNRHVLQGLPFRDAYKKVGNLSLEVIKSRMDHVIAQFSFAKIQNCFEQLLRSKE